MKRNHEGASGSIPASGNSTLLSARQLQPNPLLRPRPYIATGKSAPPFKKLKPTPISGEDHYQRILLRRATGEVFIFWLLDRCRILVDGSCLDYLERYLPEYLAQQLWRTSHPGRDCGVKAYIDFPKPNYGIVIKRIDWEIWTWYTHECTNKAIQWVLPGEEPLEFRNNEWMELSNTNLRGDYSAWKHFTGLSCSCEECLTVRQSLLH